MAIWIGVIVMKDTLVLQCGGASNAVGSHFWNFQDELYTPIVEEFGKDVDITSDSFYSASVDEHVRRGRPSRGTTDRQPRVGRGTTQGL